MDFKYVMRPRGHKPPADTSLVNISVAKEALRFHATIPGYDPTPLHSLPALAEEMGIASFHVKDESLRFGLNAFKGLGGSFAVASILAEQMDVPLTSLTFQDLSQARGNPVSADMTFITATDGNHGRGLAWFINKLGYRSVVYMPKGSAKERLDNILAETADARITPYNYDGAVHLAEKHAKENDWVLVQDTAWEGYEKIPTWIMQGYTTIAAEIHHRLKTKGGLSPTHVFLQAGVGSFAGAMLGYLTSVYGEDRPKVVIVEPASAACHYKSAKADDGLTHFVKGDMLTIMAGLACGEPSIVSWDIIDAYADAFITCPDYVAAEGMRVLGNPLPTDPKIISGESGAVTTGLLREIMHNNELRDFKAFLGLGPEARVIVISTEGDTDKENYKQVVWDGKEPNYRSITASHRSPPGSD